MNVVLFGPPGAGKGTQSQLLADQKSLRHISTGDLLREAVKNDTPFCNKIREIMNSGALVPDDVMIQVMEEVFQTLGDQKFILDGFPRTVPQAQALEQMLSKHGIVIDKAMFLEVSLQDLIGRLRSRLTCATCGAVYNAETHPPKRAKCCDLCDGPVEVRTDDNQDTIYNQLMSYENSTKALKTYFAEKKMLLEIDGNGRPEEVLQRIGSHLGG